jgi:hypothetical protein
VALAIGGDVSWTRVKIKGLIGVIQALWDAQRLRLLPGEHIKLASFEGQSLLIADYFDGWYLHGKRWFGDDVWLMRRTYRMAAVEIRVSDLDRLSMRSDSSVLDYLRDRVRLLVRMLRDGRPPRWRLFGRPKAKKVPRSRLSWGAG